jgi:hypothetical protein
LHPRLKIWLIASKVLQQGLSKSQQRPRLPLAVLPGTN